MERPKDFKSKDYAGEEFIVAGFETAKYDDLWMREFQGADAEFCRELASYINKIADYLEWKEDFGPVDLVPKPKV